MSMLIGMGEVLVGGSGGRYAVPEGVRQGPGQGWQVEFRGHCGVWEAFDERYLYL
jgi:hypothetical protein